MRMNLGSKIVTQEKMDEVKTRSEWERKRSTKKSMDVDVRVKKKGQKKDEEGKLRRR